MGPANSFGSVAELFLLALHFENATYNMVEESKRLESPWKKFSLQSPSNC